MIFMNRSNANRVTSFKWNQFCISIKLNNMQSRLIFYGMYRIVRSNKINAGIMGSYDTKFNQNRKLLGM